MTENRMISIPETEFLAFRRAALELSMRMDSRPLVEEFHNCAKAMDSAWFRVEPWYKISINTYEGPLYGRESTSDQERKKMRARYPFQDQQPRVDIHQPNSIFR